MLTRNTQKYAVQLPGHHNMLSYLKVLVREISLDKSVKD